MMKFGAVSIQGMTGHTEFIPSLSVSVGWAGDSIWFSCTGGMYGLVISSNCQRSWYICGRNLTKHYYICGKHFFVILLHLWEKITTFVGNYYMYGRVLLHLWEGVTTFVGECYYICGRYGIHVITP